MIKTQRKISYHASKAGVSWPLDKTSLRTFQPTSTFWRLDVLGPDSTIQVCYIQFTKKHSNFKYAFKTYYSNIHTIKCTGVQRHHRNIKMKPEYLCCSENNEKHNEN